MNQRLILIVSGLVIVVAGGYIVFSLMNPVPERTAATVSRPAPTPAPAVAPAKPAEPEPEPAPAPAPAPDRPVASRRAAPKPAPAPAAPAHEPVANLGTLNIDTDVPGAQVFIDRAFVGAAPLVVRDVSPGKHRLNVSAQGYDGVSHDLDVAAGSRDVMIKLREVRLEAAIDVVHKHRLGSCKGRLVARPQGMRYETTEKDDAFSAGLLDLETFQVDYLAKNLRVQPGKGKRYDFTDPDGNADRLFVFHRDVEKARERLKKGDTPAAQ